MWQVAPLSKVQSQTMAGLLFGLSNSESVALSADPLHGSPLMFHNGTAGASHCCSIEFSALTAHQTHACMVALLPNDII